MARPDLNRGIEQIEKLLAVRAMAGGQHPVIGTIAIIEGPRGRVEVRYTVTPTLAPLPVQETA